MSSSATTVRRGLFGMFAGGLLAFGSAAIIAPVANAQPAPVPVPAPNCSASAVAGTVSAATASEGAYLTANPADQRGAVGHLVAVAARGRGCLRAFFAQNPQVEEQLKAIHQPVSALQSECDLELAPTPVAQAVWSGTEPAPVPVTPDTAEVPEVRAMEQIPAT